MDISFYPYIHKYYLFLAGAYGAPFLSGMTLVLLGALYFILFPHLGPRSALISIRNPFSSFLFGSFVLFFLIISIFFLTLGIVTIPFAFCLLLLLVTLFVLSSLNVVIVLYTLVLNAFSKSPPLNPLVNYILFLAALVGAGALSLIPILGSMVLSLLFIISVGSTCKSFSSRSWPIHK